VKPFFVFSGLSLVKKDRPFTSGSDSRALIRSSAWEAYYNGEIAEAAALFESAGPPPPPLVRVLSHNPAGPRCS